MTRALIVGVSGQDGAYLARLLRARGYDVWGTSRDAAGNAFAGLDTLDIRGEITLRTMPATDATAVAAVFDEAAPDEVYNLGGQSSVGQSFAEPVETWQGIVTGTQNLLEAIRRTRPSTRFYSAGSSESFGDRGDAPATEDTPLQPKSPYGVAKSCAYWQVATYREAYGLFAVTGILFNHESRLRPPRFVTAKIIRTAHAIAQGRADRLDLGNVDIVRDWGWAPEYVDAMWRMLQTAEPRDYVVASGESMTLRDFARHVFAEFGLDLDRHLHVDPALIRPNELQVSRADPSRARAELGWRAYTSGRDLVKVLCDGYLADAGDA